MRPSRIVAGLVSSLLLPVACGGIVRDSRTLDGGTGGAVGYGGFAPMPTGGAPSVQVCGNDVLDPGEDCDVTRFGNATCSSRTMGALPSGSLLCTSNCMITTARCRSANTGGTTGAGGVPNVGGFGAIAGAGGAVGMGGDASCYARGGVPYPPGSGICNFGVAAQQTCTGAVAGTAVGNLVCQMNCACTNCASTYAHCAANSVCSPLLQCAANGICKTVETCGNCTTIVDDAGGLGVADESLADAALTCLWQNGCEAGCFGE